MNLMPLLENGNGSILKNIGKYVTPSLLLAYVVYMMSNILPALDDKVDELHTEHALFRDSQNRIEELMEIQNRLLRSNCLNTAENKEETLRCNQ